MSGSSNEKHDSGQIKGPVAKVVEYFKNNPIAFIALIVVGLGAFAVSSGVVKPAKKVATTSASTTPGTLAAKVGTSSIAQTAMIARAQAAMIARAQAATVSPAVVKLGETLFKQNCEVCHQADAIGKPGVAPSLINPEFLSISSDKFLEGTIRDGREDTGMGPFAHLGRSKVQAIVQYLRSHQTLPDRAAEVDGQPDAHGDPRLGQQWYNNICSTCHGVAGDGYIAGGTGTAIGLKGFLNKATDGFIRETIKYGRSNTRMLGFQGPAAMANLSDQEIDDIIVYLRSQAK